jgi:hypothetical protein
MFGAGIEGKAYKIAIVLAALILVSTAVLIWGGVSASLPEREYSVFVTRHPGLAPENDDRDTFATIVSVEFTALLTLFASAVGTALAVIFGWRADRRKSEELQLRVLQLESRIAQDHHGNEKPS